ncbi:MAG: OmpA family protein, partial [Chloroflexi bacterium]|nr:OmpA family protein [Chloroflexota bacterium]
AQATVEATRQQVTQLQQQLATAQQQLQSVEAERRQWQERQATAEQALTTIRQQLAQTTTTATATQQKLQDVEAALAKERTALAEAQKTQAAQMEELGRLQQLFEREQQALATMRQELQTTRAAFTEARTLLLTAEQQQVQSAARTQRLVEQVRQHLAEPIQRQTVTVEQDTDIVKLQVASDALFLGDGASIRGAAQKFLDTLAALLQTLPDYQVRVEGHTDNVAIAAAARKQWPTNWEMSAARAAAIGRYLTSKGLEPARLSIGGYGASRPVAPNETPEGQAQNRRIDLLIHLPSSS